jgi:lysyl-tRNA synthetase class 2
MYLQTSPEYAMKRLLAAGIGDCYQVCHVFRDGERGRYHNPEFTMIEWYRLGFDGERLMDDVESLVAAMMTGLRRLEAAERVTYRDAVRTMAGIDPMTAAARDVAVALQRHAVPLPASVADDRGALLDLLVSAVVGPRLGIGRPLFLHDYPASQAALARLRPGDPPVAERFELYLDGLELANGFAELCDAKEQRSRFESDLDKRAAAGKPLPPVDERLLSALASGLPECAGVALGFDRVVMTALSLESIDEAMAFTSDRA